MSDGFETVVFDLGRHIKGGRLDARKAFEDFLKSTRRLFGPTIFALKEAEEGCDTCCGTLTSLEWFDDNIRDLLKKLDGLGSTPDSKPRGAKRTEA